MIWFYNDVYVNFLFFSTTKVIRFLSLKLVFVENWSRVKSKEKCLHSKNRNKREKRQNYD